HEQLGSKHTFADIVLDRAGSPNICNAFRWQSGDIEQALAEADEVFDDVFESPITQHVPMEPHACIAYWDRGRLIVHATTQTPHVVRAQLAETFKLPLSAVRVLVPSLGGGYGAKAYPKLEPVTAALAWKAGRPVKLALTRAEEFHIITAHATRIRLRTGVTRDGRFLARDATVYWNTGAYADIGVRAPKLGGFCAIGPYRFQCARIESIAIYTNIVPAGALRGYMTDQGCWAHERQTDLIAHRLGIDPLELRLKNVLRTGDRFISGEPMEDAHFKELIEEAARGIGWNEVGGWRLDPTSNLQPPRNPKSKIQNPKSTDGRLRGRGLAFAMVVTITPSTSSALVKLNEDGSATALVSTVEMGQGARTVLSQFAADALALPVERVAITDPDTDATPYDTTTTASRSTAYMGQAVKLASQDARAQLLRLAADLLEVSVEDLETRDGRVAVRGLPERSLSYAEVIRRTGAGDITGRGTGRALGGWDAATGKGRLSAQWHQGAVGAEVAVDPETGAVEVTRLHMAGWAGRVVNPRLASLQSDGNVTFGIGQALLEEMVFDNGQLANPNLADYMIPSIKDLPDQFTTVLLESPDPDAEVHGLGETCLPPMAPAIANAVQAAAGAALQQFPLTPQRVLEQLQ
ncbi:MAG: molybdopterin-dependent oxidoreductase, partial [Chloroflexi bacterium]|nr:molybdopterin-dependent oxidoreductase [Chloroflexota bacterium]